MLTCFYVLTEQDLTEASFSECSQFLKMLEGVAFDDIITDFAHFLVKCLVVFHDRET